VDGTQQHHYPILDMSRLPLRPVEAPTGGHLTVQVELPGRTIDVAVWSLQVGRVALLLLDTDVPSNEPADRPITHTLYIRGREMRFCQELVLGIGSVRALRALGIEPSVWHVNEGHAAMSVLERLADEVEGGASMEQATAAVTRRTVFMLHTPVPAGNETFDRDLVEKYLSWWTHKVGTDTSQLHALGWSGREGHDVFDLGALAIRHATVVNGVSHRHAEVASRDWAHLLGEKGAVAITNGVHPATWVGRDTSRSLTRAVGTDWEDLLVADPTAAGRIHDLPDEEIWERHHARKDMLVRFARARLRSQLARHGGSPDDLRSVERMLPPDRLTIGFARRFATYKRATLVFHNVPWLQSILTDPDRPVQMVFAGKAHPADRHGQRFIQHIVELSKSPELGGHIYVLEDYDLRMGRFLTQGVDVWLNNPRIPQEASGTSGMKVAMNGGLNLSVADGWWIEGYNEKNGWLFGSHTENPDHGAQDAEDAVSLYECLQEQVVPLYYDRGTDRIPHGWVRMMKEAIASTIHQFSTHRMVQDYVEKAYLPVGR
jgi:starch phosphorylase